MSSEKTAAAGALIGALIFFAAPWARADETRVITFVEGAAPHLELDRSPLVEGALTLQVHFVDARPLCYAYSVALARGAAARSATAPAPRAAGWVPQPGPDLEAVDLGGVEGARTMLGEARQALERAVVEARGQGSLEAVWAECDTNSGDPGAQRWRVETTARIVAIKAGPGGAWRRAVERALAVARAVRIMAERLRSPAELERELSQREQTLVHAEREEREAAEHLAAAARAGKKLPSETERHERARETVTRAGAAVAEAKKQLADRARSHGLAEAAYGLEQQARSSAHTLEQIVIEVERARALLLRAPGSWVRHISPGRAVVLSVVRTRLRRGLAVAGDPGEAFDSPTLETLPPILFDIGAGPALTLHQTEAYGLGVAPTVPNDQSAGGPALTRVIRTEEEINLDGVVSLSAYIWGRRYLDDTILHVRQLLPRPMLGLSMRDPFSSIYLGAQIDPVQFVDVSFGARWFTRERLIGPQLGEPALLDENGDPAPPVTQDEYFVAPFVSLTFSTDLIHRWIRRGF